MAPGRFFPLRLCMTQIWQSSTGLLESSQAGSNPRIPAGPGVFKLIAPGGEGRRKRKKSSAVGSWDVERAETFGTWVLRPPSSRGWGGFVCWGCSWIQHQAAHVRWTLFSAWIPWLQQGHTALIDSQTAALWLSLIYTFNLQLQKSLLLFCLSLLRPRPIICAFKSALLIAKVLKLSLG